MSNQIINQSVSQVGVGQSAPIVVQTNVGRDVVRKYLVTLKLDAAGTAKVESSDDGITWVDFGVGDVTVTTQDATEFPIHSYRINVTTGNWTLTIRGDLD